MNVQKCALALNVLQNDGWWLRFGRLEMNAVFHFSELFVKKELIIIIIFNINNNED